MRQLDVHAQNTRGSVRALLFYVVNRGHIRVIGMNPMRPLFAGFTSPIPPRVSPQYSVVMGLCWSLHSGDGFNTEKLIISISRTICCPLSKLFSYFFAHISPTDAIETLLEIWAMTQTSLILPFTRPLYDGLTPYTDVGLRLAAGLFLVPHGAQKLFGWFGGYGPAATGQFFEQQMGFSNGYLMAVAAGSVEFFGGLLLALGLLTRPAAAAASALLLVALTVHLGNGFFWTEGGYEYPLLWLIVTLTFVVKGGGAYSLDRMIGKEF